MKGSRDGGWSRVVGDLGWWDQGMVGVVGV